MLFFKSVVIGLLLFLYACSTPVKDYNDQIIVKSTNHKFIDELFGIKSQQKFDIDVPVWVKYPNDEKFSAPYPAIILLHSSWGLSSQEQFYANIFTQMGIAVFAIDSFTPRGFKRTSVDQTLVSSAAMIQDAFQVLDYLHDEPKVNAEKIAVMGFSKGGIVAFYSAFKSVNNSVNKRKHGFAAHIAYYPWCGIRLHDMSMSNAPVLVQGGGKDIITPVKKCQQLVDDVVSHDDAQKITIKQYPKARHAFDHPTLAKVPMMLALDAQVPALCDIRQNALGEFIEMHSNIKVTGENIKSVLEACSTYNGNAGSHRRSAREALEVTKSFLTEHILQ